MDGFPESRVGPGKIRGAGRDGILILDSDRGVILEVDPFLTELLGRPREQLLGRRLDAIGFFNDRAKGEALVEIVKAKAFVYCDDLQITTREGRGVLLELAGNVYLADGKKVIQFNFWEVVDPHEEEALTLAGAGCQNASGH